MMVLCGSSMSFMERQVLGYESPLYGRRTAQIKVEPFGYADVRKFLPRYSNEDAAIAYGLTDGIPQYLRQLDDGISIRDNIRWNILDPSCYLFEEPDNLLKQELRSPAEYNAVIQAIASGASRSNTIATACHMESSSCATYLRNLIDFHRLSHHLEQEDNYARNTHVPHHDQAYAQGIEDLCLADFDGRPFRL